MKSRIYWGVAILIVLLIGVSVFMLIRNTDTEPIKVYKVDVDPKKHVEKTEVGDTAAVDPETPVAKEPTSQTDVATSKTQTEYATEFSGYHKEGVDGMYLTGIPRDPDRFAHLPAPPLPPSAVPADCPEHLKFLPEWIDGVYHGIEPPPLSGDLSDETKIRIAHILLEIVREHNPKRPYAEIWDQFIEYERMYRAYAEWELGYTPMATTGANRLDWIYEQTWAFPEFLELGISTTTPPVPYGEENRFNEAMNVAMGYLDHGWNKITLKDGRDFFIKGNTRYEFFYSGVTEEGDEWNNTTRFARVPSSGDYPTVRIDVFNTSDEDLEALMGWDYTINPITLRPLVHDSSHVILYHRSFGAD